MALSLDFFYNNEFVSEKLGVAHVYCCITLLDGNRTMSSSEVSNSTQILRSNCSSAGVVVPSMSDRELKTLKAELKNLRQSIVDSLSLNGLKEIEPILCLLAFHKCDPTYKYPSFDFISMFLICYVVSFFL